MTPLMHAAYKGKLDMCRLLLRHGADVNCHQHEHGYTALMFAALSGEVSVFTRQRLLPAQFKWARILQLVHVFLQSLLEA